jgi:hypothetical protein
MPIQIRYLNDDTQECVLRPAPFISIDHAIDKTGGGDAFGSKYNITLTGKLLEDRGFPLARDAMGNLFQQFDASCNPIPWPGAASLKGPYETFDTSVSHYDDNRPLTQVVPANYKLDAILYKQKVLRALFSIDGQRMEVTAVHGNQPEFVCYPRVVSVSFSEGIYFNQCDYTINLEADTLLDYQLIVDDDGNPKYLEDSAESGPGVPSPGGYRAQSTQEILDASGAFLQSFGESWSLEVDESLGETTIGGSLNPRSYRLTHSLNATGKAHYYPEAVGLVTNVIKIPAWKNAKAYVQKRLMRPEIIDAYGPQMIYPNVEGHIGSGTLSLIKQYKGFDHSRTEEVNVSDGSYSVTETWLLASGTAYENYSMSISSEMSSPFVSVSIDGSIKGLSEISPSGEIYGGRKPKTNQPNAYQNALKKYLAVSNSSKFGIASSVYKRANNSVAVELNSQPTSISLGTNEYDGTITYNLSFDNRPTNIISGVLTENISVTDTYPGDVFAVIPVLGRATGPVLQYIGGRTEYHRDVSIELLMDYTDIPYGHDRKSLYLQKPSLVEPTRTQIRKLIQEFSPANEPGVRKYFIDPPSEQWTPKEGRYSFNLSWTYELDK